MGSVFFKIVLIIIALLSAGGAKYALKMPNDNPIEQVAEKVIKDQTGLTVDLSAEIDGSID